MTFMGKILVVVNMFIGIVFMAFAMIVYTTRVDLRQELQNRDVAISNNQIAKAKVDTELKQLQENFVKIAGDSKATPPVVGEMERQRNDYEQRIKDLTNKADQLTKDMHDFQKRHSGDEVVTKIATDNQNIRNEEIETIRKHLSEAQGREAGFVAENSELKDKLLQTTNDLNLTLKRGEEMAERIGELERYINVVTTQYDVPPIEQLAPDVDTQAPPPNIEGVITKVDPDGKHILVSLGSDDGIKKGHILEMWRTKPEPVYIGRAKVESVDHTTAVVKVVQLSGRTLPQANDRVGPNIMPYRAN